MNLAKLFEWIAAEAAYQLFHVLYRPSDPYCLHRCCGLHLPGTRSFDGCLDCWSEREGFMLGYYEDPPLFIAAIEGAMRLPDCAVVL